MAEKVKSNYSISTDEGKTYSQMEIEAILSSIEKLNRATEEAVEELFTCDLPRAMVAEDGFMYGKCPPQRRLQHRCSIRIEEVVNYLLKCGTYEIAVFVALMFQRVLGDQMPDRLKEELDEMVRELADRRIVPIIHQYNIFSYVENR